VSAPLTPWVLNASFGLPSRGIFRLPEVQVDVGLVIRAYAPGKEVIGKTGKSVLVRNGDLKALTIRWALAALNVKRASSGFPRKLLGQKEEEQ
jgi:hypothetical protein